MSRTTRAVCGLLLALVSSVCCAQEQNLSVLLGRIVDGTGAAPIEDGVIVISEDTIVAVGSRDAVDIPADAETIDLDDATILPGFINAHVHNVSSSVYRKMWARAGVTTVRDLGVMYVEGWEYSLSIPSVDPAAAHVLWAGPLVTAPGGYPVFDNGFPALEVDSPERAAVEIQALINAGIDVVKIVITTARPCESLSSEIIRAIVSTAHEAGIRVTAHVDVAADVRRALEAGVDELAHTPSDRMPDGLIQSLVSHGLSIVSTLGPFQALGGDWSDMEDNLRRFADAGGVVVFGNDAGYIRGLKVGMPIGEILHLERIGFTPMEIITFATRNAAEACSVMDTIGTLEVGKQADILVVQGDPLADLRVLEQTVLVLRRGSVIHDRRDP